MHNATTRRHRIGSSLLVVLIITIWFMRDSTRASTDNRFYDIGTPTLQTLWVDPIAGLDSHSGSTRANALRSVTAAWNKIPSSTPLSTGYRIALVPGTYDTSLLPNYWEDKQGTFAAPILLTAADGAGTVTLTRDLNIANVAYLYLVDLVIIPAGGGDVVHCERCDHFLIRNSILNGGASRGAHETLKVNQSQYVYLESNDISGSFENAVDYVAVQYGHIHGNRIHNAADWCMYTKGGSAYLRIEANEIYDCDVGGYVAGQGTGFEYMMTPWIHYEASDITFINNIIHDTLGAGMGVNGGYNILLAYNTLYRVGTTSHLIEVSFGGRSCDGDTTTAPTTCAANLARGGWGTTTVGGEGEFIPNRNVTIANNIIYNPPGVQSTWQHFTIQGTHSVGSASNINNPSRADTSLRIHGNIIWNGTSDMPLGLGVDQGCLDSNPTCNAAQINSANRINTLQPQLVDPAHGDYRPLPGGNLSALSSDVILPFTDARPSTPLAPLGDLSNTVSRDYANGARAPGIPGAYASTSSDTSTITPIAASPTATRTVTTHSGSITRSRTVTSSKTRTRTRTPTRTTATRTKTRTPTRTATRARSVTRTSTPQTVVNLPIVPRINAAQKIRLRAILATGRTLGNRAGVFAKVGDSMTGSGSFLTDVGCGSAVLGDYSSLASPITFFGTTIFSPTQGSAWCDVSNSFTAYSVSADSGWTAANALDSAMLDPTAAAGCPSPANSPLRCELLRKKPSIVLIMYGTNDLERSASTTAFRSALTSIVEKSISVGVIPVLSTIPPRQDTFAARVTTYNQAIITVASAQNIPLWNYHRALQSAGMVNHGIDSDGVHPNIYNGDQGANFTTAGLAYGYNRRNLTALQVLAHIQQVVLANGSPDP